MHRSSIIDRPQLPSLAALARSDIDYSCRQVVWRRRPISELTSATATYSLQHIQPLDDPLCCRHTHVGNVTFAFFYPEVLGTRLKIPKHGTTNRMLSIVACCDQPLTKQKQARCLHCKISGGYIQVNDVSSMICRLYTILGMPAASMQAASMQAASCLPHSIHKANPCLLPELLQVFVTPFATGPSALHLSSVICFHGCRDIRRRRLPGSAVEANEERNPRHAAIFPALLAGSSSPISCVGYAAVLKRRNQWSVGG